MPCKRGGLHKDAPLRHVIFTVMSDVTELFFDFVCPYAWRGVELALLLRQDGHTFKLRHFSLVEGNHTDNTKELNWKITDQPLADVATEGYMQYLTPSLRAFLAARAASQQGEDQAWAFTLALFRAHHQHKNPLNESTILQVATTAGLDLQQFQQALQDEAHLRSDLRQDLDLAREIGVFGTPTFVLPDGSAAYFRFENATPDLAAARVRWDLYQQVLANDAGMATIKRAKNRPARKIN